MRTNDSESSNRRPTAPTEDPLTRWHNPDAVQSVISTTLGVRAAAASEREPQVIRSRPGERPARYPR